MRHSRTRSGDIFLSSTVVFMSEIVKLIVCLILVYYEEEKDDQKFLRSLHKILISNPNDTLKVCVPSLLYIIQNNLLFVAASHLDVATYQVTYQIRILSTAMFSVIMLRRKLLRTQWLALILLVIGVAIVQLTQVEHDMKENGEVTFTTTLKPKQNRLLGLCASVGACFLSGFAGIYFERIIKGTSISHWKRNVQLSLLSIPFGAMTCFMNDGSIILSKGFFFGYDLFIWYLVLLQASGNIIIALVVKHGDTILKCFSTSLAIIISCIVLIYIFDFNLTSRFAFGVGLVIFSIFLYSFDAKKPLPQPTEVALNNTLSMDEKLQQIIA